eukprot:scaffold2804_cov371-Prasinococcus_capsulatus_cf.AAC.9
MWGLLAVFRICEALRSAHHVCVWNCGDNLHRQSYLLRAFTWYGRWVFPHLAGSVGVRPCSEPWVCKLLVQLCDGMRTVLCGILKSAGLTKFSLQSSLLAFWVLGLPMSLLLAFPCGLGVAGLWLGLAFGNACSALLLMSRIAGVSRDGLEKYALV